MSKTFTLLLATTALTAALGLPAWSGITAPIAGSGSSAVHIMADEAAGAQLWLVDDDEDDDGEDYAKRGNDDDDGEDDDDDDDECGNGAAGCKAGNNPAPAGSVAPPQNGLFGNGVAPQVQVN